MGSRIKSISSFYTEVFSTSLGVILRLEGVLSEVGEGEKEGVRVHLLGDLSSCSTGGVPFLPLIRTLFWSRGDRRASRGSDSYVVGFRLVTP